MAIKNPSKAVNLILILILGIACVFGILWFIPKWQVDTYIHSEDFLELKEPIELENDTRRTWAQILGGVFFLVTAYFTWRSLQIAKEGQITERFTKAIDQLGDKERLEVRLGGIYALERIARDSKKDHWTIMEVLSSYVRVNAPLKDIAEKAKEKRIREYKKSRESPESSQALTDISTPPADIHTILIVLGRRTLSHEKGEERHIDLMKTDLRRASLFEVNLENAIFLRANLSGALLGKANLSRAILLETDLSGAFLNDADLSGANLNEAFLFGVHLYGANLSGAKLHGASLMEASLQGAKLNEANLSGADLSEANLYGANLSKAKLFQALLHGASLSEANLNKADLFEALLNEANLSGADLSGANLYGANLSNAILCRTDLRRVLHLKVEQLSKVKTLYKAKLEPELMEQVKKDYPHLLDKPPSFI